MTEHPPKPAKPKPCPKAQPRSERRQHVLELLSVEQPRTGEEIGFFTGIPQTQIASVLILMERACLVRRVVRGRHRGKAPATGDIGPSLWSLRCWKGGAP